MWKRLQNTRGTRPTMSIGDPVLTETTLNGRDYPGVNLPSSSPPEHQSYMPRTTRTENKGLPSLPFEALPPSPPDLRESNYRPASSTYSEYIPHPLNTRMPRDSYATVTTTYTEDISPPSSPEFGAMRLHQGYKNDDNVSPIDETPDVSQLPLGRPGSRPAGGPVPASSIPVMRREKRNQVAAAAQNLVSRKEVGSKGRPTQDPRWDPYSGEITTSDRGKPQSVKPGQFSPPSLKSVNRAPGMGNESSISAAPKAQMSFTDRVRNLRINNNPPPEKPGWKGASGRVTLVNPVADNLDVKPLNIPRKVEKVASPNVVSPVSNFRRDETKDHENPLMSNPASQEQLSKSVHSKGSTPTANSPSSVIHDPFEVRQSPAVDSQREERPDPIAKNTIPRGATESTIVRNFHADLAEAFPKPGDEDYEQPPSRFSVTTYAPSTIQPTPRPSTDTWEQPEMPPLPVKQPDPPSSIVSRKRPQVLGDEPRLPRKAIGSTADPILISMNNSRPARRVSQMSTLSKNLPQSPAEASSNDIISSLQAQIDNLKHRRINIEKSIRQMTELMPQDRMTVTDLVRRKREDEKRKVEALRQEEADVRKEEHELGLKLHRAYKRRDKEGIYEPTTLWVRRVTG